MTSSMGDIPRSLVKAAAIGDVDTEVLPSRIKELDFTWTIYTEAQASFWSLYAYSIVLVSEREHDALSTYWSNEKRGPGPSLAVIPSVEGQLKKDIEHKVAAVITDTFPTESFGGQDTQLNALADHFFFQGSQLDAFGLFFLCPDATEKDVRARFRRFSLRLHPDRHQLGLSDESFLKARIVAAYTILSDAYRHISNPLKRALLRYKIEATPLEKVAISEVRNLPADIVDELDERTQSLFVDVVRLRSLGLFAEALSIAEGLAADHPNIPSFKSMLKTLKALEAWH